MLCFVPVAPLFISNPSHASFRFPSLIQTNPTRPSQQIHSPTAQQPDLPRPAMGKAARWFRNILGNRKDQSATKPKQDQQHQPPAKRWSFGKSSRDSLAAANASTAGSNAEIARAAEAAWLRTAAYGAGGTDREREQSKHAIAVAAATAAAADAAVAAAHAAVAVVRLTSKGRAPVPVLAAVRIQTAFRGFLVSLTIVLLPRQPTIFFFSFCVCYPDSQTV
jgi:hypothetical protein